MRGKNRKLMLNKLQMTSKNLKMCTNPSLIPKPRRRYEAHEHLSLIQRSLKKSYRTRRRRERLSEVKSSLFLKRASFKQRMFESHLDSERVKRWLTQELQAITSLVLSQVTNSIETRTSVQTVSDHFQRTQSSIHQQKTFKFCKKSSE